MGTRIWAGCAAGALIAAAPAGAATIDFGGLTSAGGSALTSYTEDGFVVTAGTGSVRKAFVFGNPVPAVSMGETGSVSIDRSGGLFTFAGVDLASSSSFAEYYSAYSLQGFLGSELLFSQTGQRPGDADFARIDNLAAGTVIDRLVIAFPEIDEIFNTGLSLDNVEVNAVPDPATWATLALGFGLAGAVVRRRPIPA